MSMKPRYSTPRAWAPVALAAALLLAQPLPAQTPSASKGKARAAAAEGSVTVNFVNADIEAVSRAFAAMVNRPILVDPRVKGNITVYSEQPQSMSQAYRSYQSALRGLGFAVIESGGLLKVVPEADAKLQSGTVSVGSSVPSKGEQIITQIFPLRYENPNNLVAVLRPLISANNTINANPGSNALVITDYADNLSRIQRIIAALDQPAGTDVEVISLQHAVAADLAPVVQRLTDGAGGGAVPGVPGGVGVGGSTTVIADSRSNTLLVRAPNPARMAQVRATIERLDRPTNLVGAGGGLWVVYLKNTDAVKLATVVRAAFAALSAGGGGAGGGGGGAVNITPGQGGQAGGASPQATAPVTSSGAPSTGGFIQADPSSNSLIITAPEPLYKQVRALIDQLDVRRAQVYIESMIVEVEGNAGAEFGLQWQGLLGQSGDKFGVGAASNFGTGNSIVGISAAAASGDAASVAGAIGQGLNVALLRNYGGVYSLAGILRALQSQANTNVVSTPNLITLDNEEAKIVVGENVPFITGQFTNTGGGGASVNPFQTIERKDVGITLRIRPQIGENGAIRMTIFQEQSSVKGTTQAGPSTSKRSIEGTVVVDDGQILVLGGLIEDRLDTTQNKVPFFGDLPFVGGLFRSETRTRKRSNLMVFLRPVVLRDADASTRFSADRYDQLRGRQLQGQPSPSFVMPINEAPVLGPVKPGPVPTVPIEGDPRPTGPSQPVAP
jgi:general secretion pathway protein D